MSVRAVARFDLTTDVDPVAPDESEQDELLAAIAAHRITGVAVRAMEDGRLILDGTHRDQLVAHHDRVMAATLRAEATLVVLADRLHEHSIPHRTLKGSVLAHTAAIDPADREFRDVDVLVPASRLAESVAVVESMGGERKTPELRPDFDRRFAKSVTMVLDDVEIDLHRTLAPGPFGVWMRPGDLFVLSWEVSVGGSVLQTLTPTEHLVHACYHAALGSADPALTNLRDIALLAERTDWDSARFDETIARWRGRAAVARAVVLVEEHLDHRLPEPLSDFVVRPGDARLLSPYLVSGDRFASLAPATLRALTPADRIAFARAVGFPEGSAPVDRARRLLRSKSWRSLG